MIHNYHNSISKKGFDIEQYRIIYDFITILTDKQTVVSTTKFIRLVYQFVCINHFRILIYILHILIHTNLQLQNETTNSKHKTQKHNTYYGSYLSIV